MGEELCSSSLLIARLNDPPHIVGHGHLQSAGLNTLQERSETVGGLPEAALVKAEASITLIAAKTDPRLGTAV